MPEGRECLELHAALTTMRYHSTARIHTSSTWSPP